ncbi:ABC transporter ATP-binding protein [Streptomyces sp. SID3343]|uniref:ABC transporter ATP-binding protein n=1 Tax=Streptomyces sp. SID3343 TaxID=2690260 RepID=UPI001368C9CD|nr:ABC transporter ATP-binding protein [Streptomyces sp. SID3343]MYW06280.1 ATP-binding cassette domain-containing protein [Streptomyces sp. SID3343]
MESGALLVEGLEVVYGRSVRALRGVSLDVPAHGVVAVLGANGAGKSTLLRAVSGTLFLQRGAVTAGSIRYDGERLTGRDPAVVVRAGVVQVPEGRRVFANLSVGENLQAGALSQRGLRFGQRSNALTRTNRERVFELFPVLAERRDQRAGLLSGGEQQMLAIGRALMASPRLLLLDEPSLGLAPRMVGRIAGVIREIAAQGMAVLLVEQNATIALDLADKAYVLDVGEVRLAGSSADLARTDEVHRLYLGLGDEKNAEHPGSAPESVRTGAVRRPLGRWEG